MNNSTVILIANISARIILKENAEYRHLQGIK